MVTLSARSSTRSDPGLASRAGVAGGLGRGVAAACRRPRWDAGRRLSASDGHGESRKPAPRPLRESLARDRVRAGHAWRCLGNARRRRPEDHSLRRLSDRRLSACPTSTSASERRKGRASSRHLRTSRRIAVRCAPSFTAPVGAPACRCRGGCASLTGAAISRSRSSCLTRFLNRRRIGSSASPTGPVSPCGTSCERAGLR